MATDTVEQADVFYEALRSRDARFDGRFFTGVKTTGIYCRPICPARTPYRKNVEFYGCAAAAEAAGFRPCLRCRPDTAPGSPEWRGTSSTVSRGLRLIADGALDDGTVDDLAARLGVGERHLHRLFVRHLGAAPVAIAQTHRVHLARRLLEETKSTSTEIAFASGFSSVRRFHTVFRKTFDATPQEIRAKGRQAGSETDGSPSRTRLGRGGADASRAEGLELVLRPRAPFDWNAMLAFLSPRCLPGIEFVEKDTYRRRIVIGNAPGWIEVGPRQEGSARTGTDTIELRTDLPPSRELLRLVERVRDLLDLDADTTQIGDVLSQDPMLAQLVRKHPGTRVPGAWDGFELAMRAILGQQVTVAGARTLAGRLVARIGSLTPDRVAAADLTALGVPGKRAETLRLLAVAVLEGRLSLDPWADPVRTRESLLAVPGIGPWTAEYVAMRALREPDAFPASDLGVRKALNPGGRPCTAREAERRAESWRPWRSYAVMLLWRSM